MKREINITTDKKKFFRQYVEVMKPFLGIESKRTLDVLSLLLYYNDQKKDIKDIKDRSKLIFDYDIRLAMTEELKISMHLLNNQFGFLRKKGYIVPLNILNEKILIYPEGDYEISVKFTINEE